MWRRIRHRNIVRCHGATLDPPQLALDWMENGNLTVFLEGHPNANRLGLVRRILATSMGCHGAQLFTS